MVDRLFLAVTDDPDGDAVFRVPPRRDEALSVRAVVRGRLWCSRLAGGCGGRLQINAGPQVVPYLKHSAQAGSCALTGDPARAERGYEHLLAQHALRMWLEGQGLSPVLERTVAGGRVDLLVRVRELDHVLEVQLSPLGDDAWQARDAVYRDAAHTVTWLYGPHAEGAAAREQALRGVAIVLDAPRTRVGVREATTGTTWAPLSACHLDERGFWTPHLDAAVAAHEQAQRLAHEERLERERQQRQDALDAAAAERHQQAIREAEDQRILRQALTPGPARTVLTRGPGGLLWPLEGYPRSLKQWQSAHPEARGWIPDDGWGFLDEVPAEARAGGMFVTYLVTKIYGSGPTSMFAVPGLDEHLAAVLDALHAAGVVHIERRGPLVRWHRPGHCPTIPAPGTADSTPWAATHNRVSTATS